MPAFFSLGQHKALQHAASQLQPGEQVCAYLDDLYVVCKKQKAAAAFAQVASSVSELAVVQSHWENYALGALASVDVAALREHLGCLWCLQFS